MTTLPTPSGALSIVGLAQLGGGMFAGVAIFGFLILLAMGIGGLASLGGLIYIWIRALKQPAYAQGLANCGRCGYGVRGSATMTCPECGADFREVGIQSPSMHKAFISPALFIVLWTLCLWLPGCVVSGVVLAVGPTQQINYEDVDLVPPDTKAAGYNNMMLSRTPYGMYDDLGIANIYPQGSDYIDVDIYGPNGNEWYEVDLNNSTYEDYNGAISNPLPFDRAALEKWIVTVGGDPKNADVQAQIDQAYNNIQQAQTAGIANANWSAFTISSQSTWPEEHPAGWFMLLQPLVWIVVYAAGVVVYLILKKRYDNAMAQLRDNFLANHADAVAAPVMAQPHNPFGPPPGE